MILYLKLQLDTPILMVVRQSRPRAVRRIVNVAARYVKEAPENASVEDMVSAMSVTMTNAMPAMIPVCECVPLSVPERTLQALAFRKKIISQQV